MSRLSFFIRSFICSFIHSFLLFFFFFFFLFSLSRRRYRKGYEAQKSEFAGINLATLMVVSGESFRTNAELLRIGMFLNTSLGRKATWKTSPTTGQQPPSLRWPSWPRTTSKHSR
jgi:hypothetical protein